MTRRTIVAIEPDANGSGLTARLLKAEAQVQGGMVALPLPWDSATSPALDGPDNVKAYGCRLRDALMVNPAVGQALTGIFQAPAGDARTLCFDIVSTAAERIRWEALCDLNDKFVALTNSCRLGRIADDITRQDTGLRLFTPPLRVAAFMSAAQRDATPEWSALASAIDAARLAGLDITARIYLGQQTALDAIAPNLQAGQHPGIQVLPIPPDGLRIEQALEEWRPHIVHFFCHGATGFGSPYLELATIVEHDQQADAGTIIVELDTLVNSVALRDVWFMVLNCCEGATPPPVGEERLNSMAFTIVAKGCVPAVIGMQEAVPAHDANRFCGTLYPELFKALAVALKDAAPAHPVAVDLTAAIGPARRSVQTLNAETPARFRNWTLPVLYVQREQFQVHLAAGLEESVADQFRQRVDTIASMLRQLPPSTPQSVRLQLLALLDKAPLVPPALRPDLFGNFAPLQ